MRRHTEPNPPSVRCQASDEVAIIIGTRCEVCNAPAWPIGAPCRYCDEAQRAATRNGFASREPRKLIADAVPLVTTPTAARLAREAAKRCEWGRDVPKLDPCACLPCTARRVLVEVSR